jgi:hypothetical protein
VKSARIEFDGDEKRRGVRIEGITDSTVEAIPGPIDPSTPITLSSSYKDYGLEWDDAGRNGYITALNLEGP